MEYNEFASDLPMCDRISFSSPEENEEVMQSYDVNQQVRQLGKGSFRADCAMLETDQALLAADRFNQACSMYLEPPPGTVALLVFRSAGEKFISSGESVANDKLVVLPDGSGTDMITPNLAGSDGIVLPVARYIELIETLCPTCTRSEGLAIIAGNWHELESIRNAIIEMMGNYQPTQNDEALSNLIARMVSWIAYSSCESKPEVFNGNQPRILIAKQIQEYIEAHFRETIHIEDLCRTTGKGVRTIQRSFRQYFDITITDYIKMVRLNAAYRMLSTSHPEAITVASVAMQKGFTHIGRFSVDYRKQFGESASQTLAKR